MTVSSRPPIDPPPLPTFLDRLRQRLREEKPKKVTRERLFVLWKEIMPAHEPSFHAADALMEGLRALARDGVVRLPSNTRKNPWSQQFRQAFPPHVTVLPRPVETPKVNATAAWHPILDEVVTAGIPPRRIAAVQAIDDWLQRQDQGRRMAPLKVRSYDILGDETALEKLAHDRMNGILFEAGPVTFEHLRCYDPVLPLPFRETAGPDGRPHLVVSDLHAWWTFVDWNEATRYYACVHCGHGNAVQAAAPFVAEKAGAAPVHYVCGISPSIISVMQSFSDRLETLGAGPLLYPDFVLDIVLRKAGVPRSKSDDGHSPKWLNGHAAGSWTTIRACFDRGLRLPSEMIDPVDLPWPETITK